MSLILEALRKSEAERRRGQPPDLRVERAPAPPPKRAIPFLAWLGLGLGVLVLGAAGWWWLANGDDASTPTDTASTTTQAAPASEPAAPTTADAKAPAQALPARTAPPEIENPTANEPVPPPAAPAAAQEADPPEVASPVRIPEPAASAPETPGKPSPPVDSPAPPASNPGRVLDLAELDPDTRRALPPLRLTMHLWNEVPSRRFVILDGQRLAEGDRIGEASVSRIERDGVLLEWQGRGIRVPVR